MTWICCVVSKGISRPRLTSTLAAKWECLFLAFPSQHHSVIVHLPYCIVCVKKKLVFTVVFREGEMRLHYATYRGKRCTFWGWWVQPQIHWLELPRVPGASPALLPRKVEPSGKTEGGGGTCLGTTWAQERGVVSILSRWGNGGKEKRIRVFHMFFLPIYSLHDPASFFSLILWFILNVL